MSLSFTHICVHYTTFLIVLLQNLPSAAPGRCPALWWTTLVIASTCHKSGPRRADSHSSRPARPAHRGAEALATASVLWWACREPEPSPKPSESSCAHFVRTLPAHHAARHGHAGLSVNRLIVSRSSAKPRQAARCSRAVSARGRFAGSPLALASRSCHGPTSSHEIFVGASTLRPLSPNALQTAPALADALLSLSLWY